jgi:hypothetical protein
MAISPRCAREPRLHGYGLPGGVPRVLVAPPLLAMLIGIALLAGCSPVGPPAGLSHTERAVIRSAIQSARWKAVTNQFPHAPRPNVPVVHTVNDGNGARLIIACLRSRGFTVFVDGRYFELGTTEGRSPQDYAIVNYRCLSQYPTADEVVHYLDRDRLHALYAYYASTVRPCLLLSGVESAGPPTRFKFVLDTLSRNSWNPYRVAWDSPMPAARLAFLEGLCPPIPGWFDLSR